MKLNLGLSLKMKKHSENPPAMIIREMNKDDLAFAAQCTADEGWVSENLTTLEGFFLKDPSGCLLAEENGQPVGICIATYYGSAGFIGELIIRPEGRGRGVGAALLNHGVQNLKERGVGTVYLDGVVRAVQLYERNGFRKVCRSWRFSGTLAGKKSPNVRRMTLGHLGTCHCIGQSIFWSRPGFLPQSPLGALPRAELCENGGWSCNWIYSRERG